MSKAVTLLAVSLCLVLTGCYGDLVEVPPAHVGKVFTSGGFQSGLKYPSTFRLPYEYWTEPKLVLAEVSDQPKEEKMRVFMPKDQLNLDFDVRGTFSISDDADRVEMIFSRLEGTVDSANSSILRINFDKVYETYAQQVIRQRAREILASYTISQVMEGREAISSELQASIRKDLAGTPITCKVFRFG